MGIITKDDILNHKDLCKLVQITRNIPNNVGGYVLKEPMGYNVSLIIQKL